MSMREIYIPEHILDNLIKITGVGQEYAHKTLHWLLIDIRNLGYAIDDDHKIWLTGEDGIEPEYDEAYAEELRKKGSGVTTYKALEPRYTKNRF
tara:strand:- start:1542 stop:1823 length:282 start_codon:yes stop_codon:yes gene_type:complete